MKVEALDAELERRGFELTTFTRRRLWLFNPRWLLVIAMLVIGTWVIFERAERRGRAAPVTLMLVIYLGGIIVLVVAQVRRVDRLRRLSSERYRLLGWLAPTFGASRALAAACGNPESRARTAIVGLFATPQGLFLKFDHDGLNEVALSVGVPIRFGGRGRTRWLLVGPHGDEHALPIRRLGVRSVSGEDAA